MKEIEGVGHVMEAEDIDGVTEEEYQDLVELLEEYTEILKRHDQELEEILTKVNESPVYEKIGIRLDVSTEYTYSVGEREE